jgi:capsular polysaccharide biosynthesis protein
MSVLERLRRRCVDGSLDLARRGHIKAAWWLASAIAVASRRDAEALRLLARLATESEDFERARALCAELLEKTPEDEAALRVLGRLCLAAGENERALGCFDRHAKLTLGPGTVTRLYRQRHLDIERAKQRIPYYRRLEDVLVDTAYWSIMTSAGDVYSADTHGRNLAKSPFVQGRVSGDGRCVVASYPGPVHEIREECIFVGGDENYSHWLFRNLLKLSVLESEGLLESLPWLLNRDLMPWQTEYLNMLGVGADRRLLVERGEVIRCAKLVVPALHTNAATIAGGIEWIRGRLAAQLTPPAEANGLIYVSRADARFRHVVNEDALFGRLQPLGFSKVVPGQLDVAEQIRAFSGARMVVAVHGSALTNIDYTPPHAAIVEINSSALASMDDFRRIAASRGQRMTSVISTTYADARAPIHVNSSYLADVDEIVRLVEHWLRHGVLEPQQAASSPPPPFAEIDRT